MIEGSLNVLIGDANAADPSTTLEHTEIRLAAMQMVDPFGNPILRSFLTAELVIDEQKQREIRNVTIIEIGVPKSASAKVRIRYDGSGPE